MIPTRIKTTGSVALSDEVRSYIDEKLSRLTKLIDEADTTSLFEIELESLTPHTGDRYRAEINFSSNGKVLRVEANGATLHEAIDLAVDEAALRLRKLKGKQSDLLKRSGAELKKFFRNFGG